MHFRFRCFWTPNCTIKPQKEQDVAVVCDKPLEHPRHDAAFWRLLTPRMPDWKEKKARLEASLC